MKRQYEKVKKMALEYRLESAKLDRMIGSRYGLSFSETDDDRIIDTLDYGTDDLSYEGFCERMEQYKKDIDSGKRFTNIP